MALELQQVWLEITSKCQLSCRHCYADSGPQGTHGVMQVSDWRRVIDEASNLGHPKLQFIGGEPTLHPALSELVKHALQRKFEVEVYTNLVRMTPSLWELFSLPGMRLATSYYSANADQHNEVTGCRSHHHTRANIVAALEKGIPLRVGVVETDDNQDAEKAMAELSSIGVKEITIDRMRGVGRGAHSTAPDVNQLCGRCADMSIAVSPIGEVWPCIFARWLSLGNVKEMRLADIHQTATTIREALTATFEVRQDPVVGCIPGDAHAPLCGPWGSRIKPKPKPKPKPK